jgi:hypothetical protein
MHAAESHRCLLLFREINDLLVEGRDSPGEILTIFFASLRSSSRRQRNPYSTLSSELCRGPNHCA